MKKVIMLLVLTVSNTLFCSSVGDEKGEVIDALKKKLPGATLSYVLKNNDQPEYYALFSEKTTSQDPLADGKTYTLLIGTKDNLKKFEVSKVSFCLDGGSTEIHFKNADSDPRTILMKYGFFKNAFIDCALYDQETSFRKAPSLYGALKHVGLEGFRQKNPDASEQYFKEVLSSLKSAPINKTVLSLIFEK